MNLSTYHRKAREPKHTQKNDQILSLHKSLASFLQKDLSRSFLMVHTILTAP